MEELEVTIEKRYSDERNFIIDKFKVKDVQEAIDKGREIIISSSYVREVIIKVKGETVTIAGDKNRLIDYRRDEAELGII